MSLLLPSFILITLSAIICGDQNFHFPLGVLSEWLTSKVPNTNNDSVDGGSKNELNNKAVRHSRINHQLFWCLLIELLNDMTGKWYGQVLFTKLCQNHCLTVVNPRKGRVNKISPQIEKWWNKNQYMFGHFLYQCMQCVNDGPYLAIVNTTILPTSNVISKAFL